MGAVKKVMNGGSLRSFATFMEKQRGVKGNFKVTSKGLSRIVNFDSGITYRYFGSGDVVKSRIKGAYFAPMVKKSIDKYIDSNGIIINRGDPRRGEVVVSQLFNVDAIKKNMNQPIACLDLNLCYWRTAYLLGFIDESLYHKGLETGHKKGMLVSIGALNTLPKIDTYKDGEFVSETYDYELQARYSPFYWAVIGKVFDLSMEVYKVLKDDMYMWLTDCAFFSSDRIVEVEAIFEKFGFPYKRYTSDFTYCDDKQVFWYDCKDAKEKSISIGGRNIKSLYDKWKYTHKFYEQGTILDNK